jgi:hypothetical protein
MSFFGTQALLQVMAGGAIYAADWHISLVLNAGDPWDDPIATWEVPGSRVAYTGGWVEDGTYSDGLYQGAVCNDTQIDVPSPVASSVRYIAVFPSSTSEEWLFLNRLSTYPRDLYAGDYLRFPASTISYIIYN